MSSAGEKTITKSSNDFKKNGLGFILILGRPGSGKGTLCKLVSERFGYYHLSTGDYLRELANANKTDPPEKFGGLSPNAIQQYLKSYTLIPAEHIVQIVQFKIKSEKANGYNKFLIDGFPRNVESGSMFEKEAGKPEKVIMFDCPRDVAKERFCGRRREAGDGPQVFDFRCAEFEKNNPPIVAQYDGGGSFFSVDTSGPIEASITSVMAVFGVGD